MKLKSLLLAAVISGASLMAQTSSAAVVAGNFDITMLDDGVGGFSAYFGNAFSAAHMGDSFVDKYKFTFNNTFDSSASLTSTYLNSAKVKDLDITGFSLSMIDPVTSAVLATYNGTNTTGAGNHVDTWELTQLGLLSGTYVLEVDGNVVGNGGGVYASDLTVTPAVPEPETYGMLLAGMTLLGLMARRRAKKD
jgi:hypothetical protein